LKVTASTGERLSFARALLRAIVMLVPFEFNHLVLLQLAPMDGSTPSPVFWVGYVTVWLLIVVYLGLPFFNPRRRSAHDIIAASVVVPR
ncbi:MAG: RDD family protein, partial [Anaerolineales bacterium]